MARNARRSAAGGLALFLLLQLAGTGLAAEPDGLDLHGFVAQGYIHTTDNNWLGSSEDGSWALGEFGINGSHDLTPRLRIGAQLFARSLGEFGDYDLEVDWAFADYRPFNAFGLRLGRFKIPYGLFNEVRDIDALRPTVLLPEAVYPEQDRDFLVAVNGVGAYGTMPPRGAGTFEYAAYAGTLSIDGEGIVEKYLLETGLILDLLEADVDVTWGGKLSWSSPSDRLHVAYTFRGADLAATAITNFVLLPPGTPSSITTITSDDYADRVLSARARLGDLTLTAEYLETTLEATFEAPGLPPVTIELDRESWYAQAAYRVAPRLELALTRNDIDPSTAGSSPQDPRSYRRNWILSARFDVDDHWALKLEVQDNEGVAGLFASDNGGVPALGVPPQFERDWTAFLTKVSFTF